MTNQDLLRLVILLAGELHETQVQAGLKPPSWLEALANGNPERGESVVQTVFDDIDAEAKYVARKLQES